ncbi:MarR family winged helix-turn-helix transcriptional regulator [Arthrobacter crystallopoietes]|uniref:MarR family winged helix-turn-helix transcriptional regulator n=1 Tax=Crystallibacter crystallopoietes TaxID=37928 RepID=UPI0013053853|nr:MarR family winged helix-turn-helix transcriptional regulator [Arthrobacter crystallopoietes]
MEYGRMADAYARAVAPAADQLSLGLGLRLVRASGAFVKAAEIEVQRPLKLNWSYFSTIYVISVFKSLEARTIARFTGLTRQAVSIVLAGMEKAGLVIRSSGNQEDGRLVSIRFTDQGEETASRSVQDQLRFSEKWFSVLDRDERAELNRLLEKLLEKGPQQAGRRDQ